MKKLLSLLLVSLMLLSLCACEKDDIKPTNPTAAPTTAPTEAPTDAPTEAPTAAPTQAPTAVATERASDPTQAPTQAPTQKPTQAPTQKPTQAPTQKPTQAPTQKPTQAPTQKPTQAPTEPPYTTYNIPVLPQKSKDIAPATIKTFNGKISEEGQVDEYTYIPARDGIYTFQLAEVRAEIVLEMAIYDRLGERMTYDLYAVNGSYLAVDLKAGETYTCKVFQDENFGNYILNIGEQTATTDISAYSVVNDSIKFVKQENIYTFKPERDGCYTFTMSEIKNGIVFEMAIYDRLGERITYDLYVANGTYLAVDLKAGETYTCVVYQDEGLGSYTLNIGKQKETTNIKINSIVKDSIEFAEQVNIYTFTAKKEEHTLTFSGIEKGVILEAYILNYLDETVARDIYCDNGTEIEIKGLTPGKEYTIKVYQDEKYGNYTFTLE